MSSTIPIRQRDILKGLDQLYRQAISQESCKTLLEFLKNTDISYLDLFVSMASNYFKDIFLFWRKYQNKLGNSISSIMDYLYSKVYYSKNIELNSHFAKLKYSYLKNTKNKLGLLPETQIKTYQTDIKIKQYLKNQAKQIEIDVQKDQKPKEATIISIKNQLGLKEREQIQINQINPQSRIKILKQLWVKTDLYKQDQENFQLDNKIVKTLQQRQRVQKDCSCCISFVYEDQDLTYPSFQQPVSYFESVHQIDKMENQIMKKIIGYLNGSGGSLFIGMKKEGHKILPNSEVIAQIHKEQQTNRLQSYFKYVNPSLTLNKQVTLSFLPIAQSPQKHPQLSNLVWKKGCYILRISVFPTLPHKIYYYLPQKKELAQVSKSTQDGEKQLLLQQIYDFMRERYNQYNPNKSIEKYPLREIGNIHPILVRHFGFCRAPQIGEPFYGQQKLYVNVQKNDEDETAIINPLLKDCESFKAISLLVVNRTALDLIRNIFSMKEKLNNKITEAFKDDNFRLSNNTFLVFHDCKYEKLKNGLTNQKAELKIQNEKKQVILISTLPNVTYLQQNLTKEQQQQIVSKAKIASKQNIQTVIIQGVIYFKCVSTITAVYIYFYVYHHFTLKGNFQKIPTNSSTRSKHHLKNQNKGNKLPNVRQQKNNRQNYSRGSNHYEQPNRDYRDDDYYEDYEDVQIQDSQNNQQRYEQKKQISSTYDFTKEAQVDQIPHQYVDPAVVYGTPYIVDRRYDEYGYRWDYYSNLIAYCYSPNGQYLKCEYYQFQQ